MKSIPTNFKQANTKFQLNASNNFQVTEENLSRFELGDSLANEKIKPRG